MKKNLILAIIASCSFSYAQAAVVTYDFTGHLVTTNMSALFFPSGQTFTGFISYDSTTPDASPAETTYGRYLSAPSISINLGSYTYTTLGADQTGLIGVWDQSGISIPDRFRAENPIIGPQLNYFNGYGLEKYGASSVLFSLGSTSDSVFSSDALPTSALNLADFDDPPNTYIDIFFANLSNLGFTTPYLQGRFDSLTLKNAVPEPNSIALIGLGLVGLLALRNRRKHTS